MEKQQLYLEILNDLIEKLNSNNPYKILKSTELIRSLLFDTSGPLVDKINREFKLKIEFEHTDTKYRLSTFPPGLMPDLFIIADGFFPNEHNLRSKIITTSKIEFFKTILIINDGKEYTVKDILDYVLYCLGGTHHGIPKNEQELLSELKVYFIGDANVLIYQIKSIGYVVHEALKELTENVTKKYYS